MGISATRWRESGRKFFSRNDQRVRGTGIVICKFCELVTELNCQYYDMVQYTGTILPQSMLPECICIKPAVPRSKSHGF